MTTASPTPAPINANLFVERKWPSFASPVSCGSTNVSLRPIRREPSGGLSGSKQYWMKHFAQKSERGIVGDTLYRARSMAAHWRHFPQSGSGELDLGRNPPMVFACTWSMKTRLSSGVYWILNVPVLLDAWNRLASTSIPQTQKLRVLCSRIVTVEWR